MKKLLFFALILCQFLLPIYSYATVSVNGQTYTYTNGNANDASQINTDIGNGFNNDQTLATYINAMQATGGTLANDLSLGLDGGGQQLVLELNGSHQSGSAFTGGLSLSFDRGSSSPVQLLWDENAPAWEAESLSTLGFYPIGLVVSSDPTSASNFREGWTWYNTTTHTLKYKDNNGVQTVSIVNSSGRLLGVTAYTSGTNTYTPPTGTNSIEMWVTGGGGSGGLTDNSYEGGGGGAGGTAYYYFTGGTVDTSYTCTVGAGGASQNSTGQNGNAGTNSTITATHLTTLTGNGGSYGIGSNASGDAGGAGGGASNGTLNITGGGGGGQGQSSGGTGGASLWGGGGYGSGNGNAGGTGIAPGSGGSGANTTTSGAGAAGMCLFKAYT
jgi:hypothetical protein